MPRPIVIPEIMTLKTLADARSLMRHLPIGHAQRPIWKHVASELAKAAAHGNAAEASIALRLALMIEGVECQTT